MVKLIFAARRRPGMSPQEFADYWLTTHAELARRIPGVMHYVINIAASQRQADTRPFDGFAEISYASKDDVKIAAESRESAATLADEVNVFDPTSVVRMFVDEHVIV